MSTPQRDRVALAGPGGLDASVARTWTAGRTGAAEVTVAADVVRGPAAGGTA